MQQPDRSRFDGRDLLRVQDIARMLSISVRSVWKLRGAGELPTPIRLGRSTRWRSSDIHRWIDARAPDRATRLAEGSGAETNGSGLAGGSS